MQRTLGKVDAALIEMRRLWAPTTTGRTPRGVPVGVDLSTVLVVSTLGGARTPLSVTEIADRLGIAATTSSRLCDRAVAAGYVSKSPSRADLRRMSLSLTPAGVALREQSELFRLEYLARVLVDWTPSDIDTFEQLLTRFAAAVRRDPPAPHRAPTPMIHSGP